MEGATHEEEEKTSISPPHLRLFFSFLFQNFLPPFFFPFLPSPTAALHLTPIVPRQGPATVRLLYRTATIPANRPLPGHCRNARQRRTPSRTTPRTLNVAAWPPPAPLLHAAAFNPDDQPPAFRSYSQTSTSKTYRDTTLPQARLRLIVAVSSPSPGQETHPLACLENREQGCMLRVLRCSETHMLCFPLAHYTTSALPSRRS